ncbi:uncharacterized protein [Miscanthus floridulus]|uniref:uncharacterized protein n=1 Tax=Miscanthus floridulus TaxID=154761 RepID=UPI0034582563
MVGCTRKIAALYKKFKATGSGSASGKGRGRGRGRGRGKGKGKGKGNVKGARPPSPVASSSSSEEDEVPSAHASGDEDVQEEQEQVEEEAVGSQFGEEKESANTWDHYVAARDAADRDGRVFPNKAERDFYRCQEGYEAKVASISEDGAKKLVKDMHYEARVQAIIDYYAQYRGVKAKKEEARTMNLTREQFLKGKATANIDFNPEDPPEAYSDPSIHSRVTEYTVMAREARVEAETKQREMEARMEEMIQQRVAAERQNMEEEQ